MTLATGVPPRTEPRVRRIWRTSGAVITIVLLGVGASVAYGILHDEVTAHVCVEYFTIGHVDYLGLGNPTWIAVEWGLIASWWAGLLLGLPIALVARLGTRRAPLSARELLRPTLIVLGGVGVVALVAGVIGYVAAQAGAIYLTEPLASAVPRAKHVTFLADLWAHTAAYMSGTLGTVVLCIWAWRRRNRMQRLPPERTSDSTVAESAVSTDRSCIDAGPTLHQWEAITLRVLVVIGGISLCVGLLFVLVLSMLSGL